MTEKTIKSIQEEVSKLQQSEILEELVKWRFAIPNIAKMSAQLVQFRQFAEDPDQLSLKINTLVNRHKAQLELHQKEISQLNEIIKQYAEDPQGVGRQLDHMVKTGMKKVIH